MTMHRRGALKYIILIVVFVAIFAAIIIFFNSRETVTYQAPIRPVEVMRPERHLIRETVELTGYVEAAAMIPVVPFVSGTVEGYRIEAGDTVEKGDVIAEIDKEPYELQKAQAEAAYLGLESSFQRVSALYDKGAATKQDYDALKAQLDAVRAQLDLAELQLSYATVTSPVSGTVLMAPSSVGSIASSESPLAVIADLSDLIVNVKVGERYFERISSSRDSLRVEVSAPSGAASEAEIISIAPYIDPTSKTFALRVSLSSPESFVPGMFVRISLVLDEGECLALPSYAALADGTLYALSEDGKSAEYISLERGLDDGSWFEIPDEYAGTSFIVRGQGDLVSGMPVSVVGGEGV